MIKKLLNLLGSVQIVIPLLCTIALFSIIGVVVPQGSVQPNFHHNWLQSSLITNLGLNRIFSSWWYYSLLGLLSICVVTCSFSNQFKNVRKASIPNFLNTASDLTKFKRYTEFCSSFERDALVKKLFTYFQKRLFFVAQKIDHETVQVASRSFCFKEIGSFVFHVSILFFFAGGIIGSMLGYSFVKEFQSGDIASIKNWHYLLRCDGFKFDINSQGAISGVKSKMAVLSSDSTFLFSKIVEVNHPLSCHGLKFFQFNYRELPDDIDSATLRISGPGLDAAGPNLTAPLETSTAIPGSDLTVALRRYVCDFVIDANDRSVSYRSNKPNNPAIKIELLKGSDTLFNNWVFMNFPDSNLENAHGYKIVLLNFAPKYFSGIKISKNPGNVFIWFGFAFMTIGILLLYFFPQKNIWIFVEATDTSVSRVKVYGSSSRPESDFQNKFRDIGEILQRHPQKGP